MLDIKFIREIQIRSKKAAKEKKVDIDINHILKIDESSAVFLFKFKHFERSEMPIPVQLKVSQRKEQIVNGPGN